MRNGVMITLTLITLILAIINEWRLINTIGMIVVATCTLISILIDIVKGRLKNELS